jgi:MoaA/NifB/PqqE/SkfB family radical SAM enzyme
VTQERGAAIGDYRAPLFLAWQLTNRCGCRCLHCCEESGPERGWSDELDREQALSLSRQIVELGIPYVAFGGGEPLGVPHVWEVFEILHRGGVEIKIETNGLLIDELAADRLQALEVACVQVSLDGPTAAIHETVRPDGPFREAADSIKRLARRGLAPELVFVPTRLNVDSAPRVYDLAVELGARTFVTGSLMRLGRAAAAWDALAPSPEAWESAVAALKERAKSHRDAVRLSIYPWDILREMEVRLESPQAMMLVVPNGRVKLLNALPFAVADLTKLSLAEAWPAVARGWADPKVRDFIANARKDASLLRHANECWDI